MATQNAINLKVTNNADGYDISGGTTARKLTVTGADITLTGSGTNTYTFPATSATLLATDGSIDNLTGTISSSVLGNSTVYIGTTGIALNRASGALTLAGITLDTPDIGTPSAGVLTNCTGAASGLTAGSVTNATLTTALTVNTGTVTLKGNSDNTSVLTIGSGAVSVSGSNTGDQDLSGYALNGANSDITSLSGLTTPLSVGQGGTGATTLTGILKGNGTSAFSVATDGTDYISSVVADTTPQLGGELDAQAHSIGFTLGTATGDGTTTIDFTAGNKFKFTFGAQNETFTFTAPSKPCSLTLMLVQDGTGSRTATWPATVKWAGGSAPTLTTDASAVDIISFLYDGTNYYAQASLNFS